jgi:hypothetical protein
MRPRWVITALMLAALIAAPALRAANGPAAACAAAKRKAVGKKALDRMKCAATTAIRGAIDPHCLQQAEDRFTRAFARAEQAGRCLTVGDTAALELQVDVFVVGAVGALSETSTTTTTTTSTTTTTMPACPGGGRQISDRTGVEHCWYQGPTDSDCNTTCAAVGRIYDPATETFAGSGGDDVDCLVVVLGGRGLFFNFVYLFPYLARPSEDCSASGLGGLGCFDKVGYCPIAFCNPNSYGRCATPPTGSTDAAVDYARFCACQ